MAQNFTFACLFLDKFFRKQDKLKALSYIGKKKWGQSKAITPFKLKAFVI